MTILVDPHLRWLVTVSSTFRDLEFDDGYNDPSNSKSRKVLETVKSHLMEMKLSCKAYHILLFYFACFLRRGLQQRQRRGLNNLKHVIQLCTGLLMPYAVKLSSMSW